MKISMLTFSEGGGGGGGGETADIVCLGFEAFKTKSPLYVISYIIKNFINIKVNN